ncbi:MAG: pyrimidine/purine nucleoside phosphorylase [Bacteroidales bacterium]|nr:pyrimidine/purine nucleoside phosphorylase [Bacteroidales bacterium]
MFKVNEYFDGNVKSIAFKNKDGQATIGVMAPGEYEFSTSTVEYMTVISGVLTVLVPGESGWKDYEEGETFIVEKDATFKLKVKEQTAYRCIYK